MSFEAIEKIVKRANGDLEKCRLLAKDVLWPLLPRIVDGRQRYDWRAGLRDRTGEEIDHPRSGDFVTIGLVAATKDDRFTIGAALGVMREPRHRHRHCGRRGAFEREEVLIDPSLAWKEIGPWELGECEPWDQPKPTAAVCERIAAWAGATGYDRITLTMAEAEMLIREHSPPKIHGWRFVLAPGWTLEKARAEVEEARKDVGKGVVDHERIRRIGVTAKVMSKSEKQESGLASVFYVKSIMLRGDNRWPPCITMTISWELSDHGFNGIWEREDEPFEGNLHWECPEFIEAVEVLTDLATGATTVMKAMNTCAEGAR